jgi:citrate synthase
MNDLEWISAAEAQVRLGVRPQTLYAYVSRGQVQVRPHPDDSRRSLYRAADVDALAARKGRSRKLADVASGAIAWGEPVLASAITTVRAGRFYYRGQDAALLSGDHTLEAIARLLLGEDRAPADSAQRPTPPDYPDLRQRLFYALADRAAQAPPMLGSSASAGAVEAATLLQIVADAVAGTRCASHIHERLAQAWGADPTGPAADLIRRMLVLVADHELNASTFAARVTASTGASLAASVLAGLTALSGPRHGGLSAVVTRFAAEARVHGEREAVQNRLIEGRYLPGFGHPLYPQGDIRAATLLDRFEVPSPFAELRAVAKDVSGAEPNIDFAMVAACAASGLPEDAPFAIFATARCAGWIAHAIEQGQSNKLIRPRARYIGPDPD